MGGLRRALAAVVGMLLVALAWSLPATAQTGTGGVTVTADPSNYPSVAATLTVPPSMQVIELNAGNFELTENGKPQTIKLTKLSVETLEVVVVIDTSGSMSASLSAAKQAAVTFIGRMPATTRIAIIGFGRSPTVVSPFTLDRTALVAAVNALQAKGETAIYDAIGEAIALFTPGKSTRKSLVLLSDGADTVSQANLDQTLAQMTESGVRLDAVALGAANLDTTALVALAAKGGGTVASAQDSAALAGVYDNIASRLLNAYVLTYNSKFIGPAVLRIGVAAAGSKSEVEIKVELGQSASGPGDPQPIEPDPADGSGGPVTASLAPPAWMLAGGAVAFFLAILLLAVGPLQSVGEAVRASSRTRLGGSQPVSNSGTSTLSRAAERATAVADQVLEKRGSRRTLNTALERAGIALRSGEFLVLVLSAMTVAFLLGLLASGLLLGLLFGILCPVAARMLVGILADRRRRLFGEQLGDVLQLMTGSLRAGYAFLQAADTVASEAENPSAEEFRRLIVEARLGRSVSDSLAAMAERVGSEDFGWVVGAIEIHREVGGDLAEVLDTVAATIRERAQLFRQMRALSAEGRISAYVIGGLPFALIAVLSVINPGYLDPLTEGGGLVLSGVAVALMVAGVIWLRRICRLVY